ncbi:MAG: hypothetical protein QM709_14860 [Spongiibacteraceae bacterium]
MTFIYIEIAFVILLSWAIGGVLLRGLYRSRAEALELAARRTKAWRELKAQLHDARLTIANLEKQQAGDDDGAVGMSTVLAEFEQDCSNNSEVLNELGTIHGKWLEVVDRLEQGSSSTDIDHAAMLRELTLLREQHARSGGVIAMLSRALERNRERIKELEASRPRERGQNTATAELEAGYRRLAHENKSLHSRMQKATEQHQEAIARIGAQLRMSDEKYRAHVREAKDRQDMMQAVIDQLRQQLRDADGQQLDATRMKELLARVQEMDDELARTVRERDFLDARYQEIEQALLASESAVKELERTRVEYRMLEERYLEMEENIYKKVAAERRREVPETVSDVAYREKGIDVITDD